MSSDVQFLKNTYRRNKLKIQKLKNSHYEFGLYFYKAFNRTQNRNKKQNMISIQYPLNKSIDLYNPQFNQINSNDMKLENIPI